MPIISSTPTEPPSSNTSNGCSSPNTCLPSQHYDIKHVYGIVMPTHKSQGCLMYTFMLENTLKANASLSASHAACLSTLPNACKCMSPRARRWSVSAMSSTLCTTLKLSPRAIKLCTWWWWTILVCPKPQLYPWHPACACPCRHHMRAHNSNVYAIRKPKQQVLAHVSKG